MLVQLNRIDIGKMMLSSEFGINISGNNALEHRKLYSRNVTASVFPLTGHAGRVQEPEKIGRANTELLHGLSPYSRPSELNSRLAACVKLAGDTLATQTSSFPSRYPGLLRRKNSVCLSTFTGIASMLSDFTL